MGAKPGSGFHRPFFLDPKKIFFFEIFFSLSTLHFKIKKSKNKINEYFNPALKFEKKI